ncbi:N-terminal kinase-like protein [Reticulomyxa filosa]|uniref:N-terminal kinase-like protein n=1 Tax=Reticulomyxa filosa TaxID=46433 RepID=X6NN95_RETFI|nr:N-terminal kinase-like protein [Reticulomyxa filosa]|eukprot:ETO27755.1 N-terminal kinase-like protein [Reticulomyxa filosa]
MIHGQVSPSSIFVTKAGDWKLGGFELAHAYGTAPDYLVGNFDLLPSRYKPKELAANNGSLEVLSKNPIHSLDSWCLGCVIYETFNGRFEKPQELSKLNNIPKELQQHYKRLLATQAQLRLTTKSLLSSPFFEHPLVRTVTFLDEIALKSDKEKAGFYKSLDQDIESFPIERCKYRILPALSHVLEHGSGSNPVILSCVLKISKMLTQEESEKMVKPVLINLFKNNERGIRINLLKNLDKFVDCLDSKTISKDIFPCVINGFTDQSPVLRECSVRSVLHFASKLDTKTLHEVLMPVLVKLQAQDTEPAIRTNTTIVFGKIASYLEISKMEVVLVKAFARALQDAFTPARNAALNALNATMGLYSPVVLSKHVLPMICTCTTDPYKSVRDQSFKCLELGLQRLQQYALTLPEKPQQEGSVGDPTSSQTAGSSGTHARSTADSNADQNATTTAAAAVAVGTALTSVGTWAAAAVSNKLKMPDANQDNNANDNHGGGSNHIGELRSKPTYKPTQEKASNKSMSASSSNLDKNALRLQHRTKDSDTDLAGVLC